MKKFLKWLAAILAVGSVVGIVIAYLCKECKDEDEDFRFDCDEDDFDLDSDLQPVSERGYVSLKKSGAETEPAAAEAEDKDSAAEKPAEEVLADDTEVPEKEALPFSRKQKSQTNDHFTYTKTGWIPKSKGFHPVFIFKKSADKTNFSHCQKTTLLPCSF